MKAFWVCPICESSWFEDNMAVNNVECPECGTVFIVRGREKEAVHELIVEPIKEDWEEYA